MDDPCPVHEPSSHPFVMMHDPRSVRVGPSAGLDRASDNPISQFFESGLDGDRLKVPILDNRGSVRRAIKVTHDGTEVV